MHSRLPILVMVCLLLAVGAASAADPPPPPATTVAILFVQPDGEWDRALQDKWDQAGTLRLPAGCQAVPWARLVSGPGLKPFGPEQRELLMKYPELLVESTRRLDLLGARYVVLAYTSKPDDPRLRPLLFDLSTGSRLWLPLVKEGDRGRSLAALGKQLDEGLARMGRPVWGNVAGKQYHVTGCDHVRSDQVINIANENEARANGYEACAICFPAPKAPGVSGTEMALGREIASYIERRYQLDHDAERQGRVERVGRRVVAQNRLTSFPYHFRVLDTDTPNAFAAGAGYVFITRGLEKVTAGNDDMLAAILGHEIAHNEAHHVLRQYRQAQQWAVIGAIISVATRTNLGGLLADFAGGLISRGHSRGFEVEADRGGVLYAYGGGYRPEDFELVLNALKKISKPSTADWLRTHPTEERRLALTRQLVGDLRSLDQVVVAFGALDPAFGAWVRQNASRLLARRESLSRVLSAMRVAMQPAPVGTAPGPSPGPAPGSPSGLPGGSEGTGGPSSRPVPRSVPSPAPPETSFGPGHGASPAVPGAAAAPVKTVPPSGPSTPAVTPSPTVPPSPLPNPGSVPGAPPEDQ